MPRILNKKQSLTKKGAPLERLFSFGKGLKTILNKVEQDVSEIKDMLKQLIER